VQLLIARGKDFDTEGQVASPISCCYIMCHGAQPGRARPGFQLCLY